MSVAKVSLEARDVAIEFTESCNCCCWNYPRVHPNTPLYVDAKGEIKKFDFNKCKDEQEALRQSVENLTYCLKQMVQKRISDQQEIENLIHAIDQMRDNKPVTREFLERINIVIENRM